MKVFEHDFAPMWRRGFAAVALSAALTTLALYPVSARAQADGPMAQQNPQPVDIGQPAADPSWIQFRSGTVSIGQSDAEQLEQTLDALSARDSKSHFLIQFDGPVSDRDRRDLADAGINLQTYLSSNAFFANTNDAAAVDAARVATIASVQNVASIQDSWKLHDFLAAEQMPTWAIVNEDYLDARVEQAELATKNLPGAAEDIPLPKNPRVGLYVSFHPDVVMMPDAWLTVMEYGGVAKSFLKSINSMVVELPFNQIKNLAAEDSVMYIEPALPHFSELNNSNRTAVGADTLQVTPYDLDGAGVTVFVYDGGEVLSSHQDFAGRITVIDTAGVSDHSTHVAGTIGGDGAASGGLYRGMAPAVTLISAGFEQPGGLQQGFLYTDPGDLEADYTTAIQTHGAVIANNSIGTNTAPNGYPCDWEGNYGNTSALIDAIVRGSLGSPMRIVWANGNERQTTRCLGVEGFQSPYHSTAPPACAKNHITVGALNSNDDSVTSFTSFGPTDDGRIKPDVSGPGCQSDDDNTVTSASSSGGYTGKCGTSMASPTVCGIGALCIQAHRQSARGSADMLPSTLKAILANTAEDMGRPGPDYEYGHGSVRGIAAVDLIDGGHFREDSISQGETYSAVVIVGPGDTELRITLAWDDVPAAPLVIPSLVNDLDLAIIDGGGTRHYPFILDPANPTSNATNTTENRLDNIEQIVIPNPTPGAYRVEVTGFNVSTGPQTFSLAATPSLLTCSSQGFASIGGVKFACESTANLQVIDCDINTDDLIVDTVDVTIASDTEPGGEVVTLTEIDPAAATFAATITLSQTDSVGVLHISPGDTVTMTYVDADDGQGGNNVNVQEVATVDCTGPSLVSTAVLEVNPRDALVNVVTDELTQVTIRYGTDCLSLNDSKTSSAFLDDHDILLSDLQDDVTYFFAIDMTDQAGNMSSDDNGGACYTFTTPEVPDFFTESFAGSFDLDGVTVLLSPDAGVDQYVACATPIATLPVDPAGGTPIVLTDDDSETVALTGGQQVLLYGVAYSSVFVGSNGYVTLGTADTDYDETLGEHFQFPRIAGAYDDLNPTDGGTVSSQQLGDRLTVTWENISQFNAGDSNTFQISMFFNGDIEISWLGMNPGIDCIVGLSEGVGLSPDYFESDLAGSGSCGPRAPTASNLSVQAPGPTPIAIDLIASDDGTPGPLSYIVTSLPTYELRDAGDSSIITTVPHVLTGGGNQVTYTADPGFNGPDSFQFQADDGGTPPNGGLSGIATVSIDVLPILELPFNDNFETTVSAGTGFDPNKWQTVVGAEISGQSLSPPSPTMAARFNGDPSGADSITTQLINMSSESAVRVSYYFQQTGGGESPDSGDDLFIEYLNDSAQWIELAMYPGADPDMTVFQFVEHLLPVDALHAAFRLRIRNTATSGLFDDWFVDDVAITPADSPSANNVNTFTPVGIPVNIALDASDPNGDTLEYIVETLPANGTLRDADDNSLINSVPYTLLNNGDTVVYLPSAAFNSLDSFDYSASDGVNGSNIATVGIDVGGPQPVLSFPLDTDPGWTTEGDWAFGVPAGLAGDPNSGFTGANVLGYNLNGAYPSSMAATLYLTTASLDLTSVTDVSLRFRRWLGVESATFDHASIQVSNDGAIWTTVYDHTGGTLNETAWSAQQIDISSVADNQAAVFIRWGMGTTDGSVQFQGWNLDDIEIWGQTPSKGVLGDTNGDGLVNVFDLLNLLNDWGPCPGCSTDLNNDNQVNVFDLLILLDNWTIPAPLSAPQMAGDITNLDVGDENDALEVEKQLIGEIFVNNGLLVPADHGGYFEVDRHYRQTAVGELGIELAGRIPVELADILVVPDRAQLDGTLTVWLAQGFVPTPGDTFKVLVAGAIEGEFNEVLLPDLTELLGVDAKFELVYDRSTVSLRVPGGDPAAVVVNDAKSLRERGDVDRNGRLDVNDVLALIDAWGDNSGSHADLNGDDVVDAQDLAILLRAPLGPRHSALEEEVRK